MSSSPLAASGPNAEQIAYWNEVSAERWLRYEELLDRQLAPFGALAIQDARVGPGSRVIDVGCGCGATTLELARRVGPGGAVVAVDIATALLTRARERAEQAGLENIRFENADAQTHELAAGSFDAVVSRFGVMFFADPERAFANLRRALRREARLSFVCWKAVAENPWVAVPLAAVATEVPLPPRAAPDAPGPFAFADGERVRGILAGAGYSAIEIRPHREEITIAGGGADEAAEFLAQIGPTSAALRSAPPEARPKAVAAIRRALEPFDRGRGVRFEFAVWRVTASA